MIYEDHEENKFLRWINSSSVFTVHKWGGLKICGFESTSFMKILDDSARWISQDLSRTFGTGKSVQDYEVTLVNGEKEKTTVYAERDANGTFTDLLIEGTQHIWKWHFNVAPPTNYYKES
jgi:hypothetical protein